MRRVLITGMSATGKSSVVEELVARGYDAVDTDYGWCQHAPDGEWIWHEERVSELLAAQERDPLILAGCASNQRKFYPLFDAVILLSAPRDVIVERLGSRTNNPFGSKPDELAQVLDDLEHVEPLLRASATHEIDTTVPLEAVVSRVLEVVEG